MASPQMFTDLFAEASPTMDGERLERWFDHRTSTFGGEDAISVVRSLFGSVARFDFGKVSAELPRVDLPDLLPFFKAALVNAGRRPVQEGECLLFKTPEDWAATHFAIAERYDLVFSRSSELGRRDLAGVGHVVVDCALRATAGLSESLAALDGLERPFAVFLVKDRVTGGEGLVRQCLVAAQRGDDGWELLKDWEVIRLLTPLVDKPRSLTALQPAERGIDLQALMADAQAFTAQAARGLELPFDLPVVEPLALLVPALA
jgi:hypothetical protein